MPFEFVHLAKAYFPIPGGIENLTQLFCEGLERSGHTVRVISFNDPKSTSKTSIDRVNGVEVLRIRPFTRIYSQPFSRTYILEAICAMKSSKELHVHWPNFIAFFSVYIASYLIPKSKRAKVVIHWHGDAVRQRPIRFLFAPIVKRVIRVASRIVVATPYYFEISDFKDELQKKKTFELPLTVTEDFEKKLKEQGGANLIPYKGGTFKITALGRYVWLKGFQDLIQAVSRISSEIEVTIMGAKDSYYDVLEKQIEEMKVTAKVKLLTNLSMDDVIRNIRESHLFVMPSKQEMAGIVQMEAMLCGKAVITTDIPRSAVNYFNQKDVTGLVVPVGDPEELTKAIEALRDDPQKLLKLSQNALKRAQNEFVTEKYKNAIQSYVEAQ